MSKTYFDDRGKPVRELDIVRNYFGRDREAAMRELGIAQTKEPRPSAIDVEVLSVDGKKKVRVRRRLPE